MMRRVKYYLITILMLLLQVAYGCNNQPPAAKAPDAANVKSPNNKGAPNKKNELNDEQQFRLFLKRFKDAVKTKNKGQLVTMFSFPLQTTPQWTNEDLKNSSIDPKNGMISKNDFLTYFDDIFTADAIKLIPASKEDDLSEIDKSTTENYYKTLQLVTDSGSTLYQLQKDYAQDNGQETSFGFVFGKVAGSYKVISYYRPWPLKG